MMSTTDDDAGGPIEEHSGTYTPSNRLLHDIAKGGQTILHMCRLSILSTAVIIFTSLKLCHCKILESGLTEASAGCTAVKCMPLYKLIMAPSFATTPLGF